MNEAVRFGLRGRQVAAFEQQGQRRHDADQPGNALRAAGAGAKPNLHLGLADLDAFAIGGHAVMAGERDLEAAAKRRAVDGAGHGLAAGFEPAQHLREVQDGFQRLGGRCGLGLDDQAFHADQVRARDEARFAGGDDDAFHRDVTGGTLDGGLKLVYELWADDVHRFARLVDGQGCDAIAVDGV